MGYSHFPRKLVELNYSGIGKLSVKGMKYRNKSCWCITKHWHQSILETDYFNHLHTLKKIGEIKDYDIHPKLELCVN